MIQTIANFIACSLGSFLGFSGMVLLAYFLTKKMISDAYEASFYIRSIIDYFRNKPP